MGEYWRRRFHWGVVSSGFFNWLSYCAGRGAQREWTSQRRAWTIVRCFGWKLLVAIGRTGVLSGNITAPMLGCRVAMELGESAGKIELVGKSQLIADGFNGQIRAVEHLHGALHSQVVEIHQRRVAGHAPENLGVMRARQIHDRGQGGDAERLAQMLLHDLDALGDAFLNV